MKKIKGNLQTIKITLLKVQIWFKAHFWGYHYWRVRLGDLEPMTLMLNKKEARIFDKKRGYTRFIDYYTVLKYGHKWHPINEMPPEVLLEVQDNIGIAAFAVPKLHYDISTTSVTEIKKLEDYDQIIIKSGYWKNEWEFIYSPFNNLKIKRWRLIDKEPLSETLKYTIPLLSVKYPF